jgi:4-hydroxy-tetrahydrodipicolinate synthase
MVPLDARGESEVCTGSIRTARPASFSVSRPRSGGVFHMGRLIAEVRPIRPDFSFLTGWEAALVPMLLVGCDGGTHVTSGIVPELTRGIYDAVRSGRIEEAFALQRTLIEIFDPLIQEADFPEGFRVAAEVCGFRMGASRQPATESQIASRKKLAERLCDKLQAYGLG